MGCVEIRCAAEGDCAHAQLLALALYDNASITGFPLIVVGLIMSTGIRKVTPFRSFGKEPIDIVS